MPTYGPTLATLGEDAGGGDVAWTNPNNITASDNTRARILSINAGQKTNALRATFPGLSIPPGEIVTGVTITIEQSSSVATTGARSWILRHFNGTSRVGANLASGAGLPSTEASADFGGVNRRWGLDATQLSAAVLNAGAKFEYVLDAINNCAINVDAMWITAHTTDPANPRTAISEDWEEGLGTFTPIANGTSSFIVDGGELLCDVASNTEPENIGIFNATDVDACFISTAKSRIITKLATRVGPGLGVWLFGGGSLMDRGLAITSQAEGFRTKYWTPNGDWTPGSTAYGSFDISWPDFAFSLALPHFAIIEVDAGVISLGTSPTIVGPWSPRGSFTIPSSVPLIGWHGLRVAHDSGGCRHDETVGGSYTTGHLPMPGNLFRAELRERERAARGFR